MPTRIKKTTQIALYLSPRKNIQIQRKAPGIELFSFIFVLLKKSRAEKKKFFLN
jgi:hypothetical protein